MVTFECPWCAEPAAVDDELDHVSCDACGIAVALAPDSVREPIARAA